MKSLMILVLFLMFVSNDCKSSDKLTKMCDILRPGKVFGGIKAYKQGLKQSNVMYGKGMDSISMEWEFVVTNDRIILLDETIASIQPNDQLKGWDQNDNHLVIIKESIYHSGQNEGIRECFIIRSKSVKKICLTNSLRTVFENGTTTSDVFKKDSVIAFNPMADQTNDTLVVGVISRDNSSNDMIYSIKLDVMNHQKDCGVGCSWPKFLTGISEEWHKKLDAVINLSEDLINPQNSWLLLLNDNSKPLFCIIPKNETFNEGCSEDKRKPYGEECDDKVVDTTTSKPIHKTTLTSPQTTEETTTVTTEEPTSETTPVSRDSIGWLYSIGVSVGLTAIIAMVVIAIFWYSNKSDRNLEDIDSLVSERQKLMKKYDSRREFATKGLTRLEKMKQRFDSHTELE